MGIWRPGEFGEDWAGGGGGKPLAFSMGFPALPSPSAPFPNTFPSSPKAMG